MIIKMLKNQGIEEASAEANMQARIRESGGKLTREMVMEQLLKEAVVNNPELQYLVNEYYDGLLLYEVAKNKVWDVAASDSLNLEAYFKNNKKNYKWEEPRFEGFVVLANEKSVVKQVKKILKKHASGDWRKMIRKEVNKDSVVCSVQGPYLCKKGENKYVDSVIFKAGDMVSHNKYSIIEVIGKKKKQPKTYKDVKSAVVADYTRLMEDNWVKELRTKYSFKIDETVLSTVK
jgi:peptidyl-prolyl cis-trans isomerase SurA